MRLNISLLAKQNKTEAFATVGQLTITVKGKPHTHSHKVSQLSEKPYKRKNCNMG